MDETLFLQWEKEASDINTSPARLEELAKTIDPLSDFIPKSQDIFDIGGDPPTGYMINYPPPKPLSNPEEKVMKAIARNRKTPTKILINLGFRYMEELAKNRIIDWWLLDPKHPLSDHNGFNRIFAANPHTPEQLLIPLAKDSDSRVRSGVARHPNTPINTLENLGKDSNYRVRRSLGGFYFEVRGN